MYVKVKVIVQAKKERIKLLKLNHYELSVKEPAERNLANQRICQIIAQIYQVSNKNIKIISGHHHPSKILSVNLPENLS